jgi:hypothetical protein
MSMTRAEEALHESQQGTVTLVLLQGIFGICVDLNFIGIPPFPQK